MATAGEACPAPGRAPFRGPCPRTEQSRGVSASFHFVAASLAVGRPGPGRAAGHHLSRASSPAHAGGLAISDQPLRLWLGPLCPEPLNGLGFQKANQARPQEGSAGTGQGLGAMVWPQAPLRAPHPCSPSRTQAYGDLLLSQERAGRGRTRTWPCALILLSKSDLGVLPACSQGGSSLPWCPHSVECCGLAGWGTRYGRRAVALPSRRNHG